MSSSVLKRTVRPRPAFRLALAVLSAAALAGALGVAEAMPIAGVDGALAAEYALAQYQPGRDGPRPGHPHHGPGRPFAPGHGRPGYGRPGYAYGHPGYGRPGYRGAWVRPYRWAPGGAIAAGVAIGVLGAAAVAAWAPPPPQPGLCWYYTDPSQQDGFWDYCQ